ncbi:hypothetical protein ACIBBD_13495 [Streptomyces sp. NPDC051315]|uniref:hypothetical protein n=1 Tax=Streptomyces sp. NPDC051315 TaxID=3365650 RepID=UPI00378B8E0A
MSGGSGGVLRLPGSAIPDGAERWEGERARRWVAALPPRWVPVRAWTSVHAGLPLAAVAGAAGLVAGTGMPGWGAALVALHLVWLVLRPEAARLLAPVAVPVVLVPGDTSWAVRLGLAAGLVGVWAAVTVRLVARKAQRVAALEASGGVTSALPGRRAPLERGAFLFWSGAATVVVGGLLGATAGLWAGGGERPAVAACWCVVGLGLTVVLSAGLGRHRAAGLRRAPVPVLRVLVRDNSDADAEVFAADDVAALRPLFTVATFQTRAEDADADRDDGEDGAEDDDDAEDDEEILKLLRGGADGWTGPLREAVLYGVPHDGAEVVLLAAAEEEGAPPVVEASVGPVRPVTGPAARRRAVQERRKAVEEARRQERHRAVAAALAGRAGPTGTPDVRRWRAGWADAFTVLVAVLYLTSVWADSGGWRYVYGVLLALAAALVLPRRLAWRITADREGLWFNTLRRPRLLEWDRIRDVRCQGVTLKVVGKPASFAEWRVHTPRWPWLERRLGVLHPYERTAAEIAALWRDPALRPTATADARQRGRALWPVGVVAGVVTLALAVLLP